MILQTLLENENRIALLDLQRRYIEALPDKWDIDLDHAGLNNVIVVTIAPPRRARWYSLPCSEQNQVLISSSVTNHVWQERSFKDAVEILIKLYDRKR